MAEYIERKAAKKVLAFGVGVTAANALDKIPTADVVEVVHGHWVGLEYDGYADGNPVYDLWECSECGNEVRGEDVPDTHEYCYACGARMDGEG